MYITDSHLMLRTKIQAHWKIYQPILEKPPLENQLSMIKCGTFPSKLQEFNILHRHLVSLDIYIPIVYDICVHILLIACMETGNHAHIDLIRIFNVHSPMYSRSELKTNQTGSASYSLVSILVLDMSICSPSALIQPVLQVHFFYFLIQNAHIC